MPIYTAGQKQKNTSLYIQLKKTLPPVYKPEQSPEKDRRVLYWVFFYDEARGVAADGREGVRTRCLTDIYFRSTRPCGSVGHASSFFIFSPSGHIYSSKK